ncbi:hypothetical protein BC937DRAFT_86309 [Endogone sp. FLAS-F59071]|nr:hypothetical protein BC937DRAFT_86309 [Endogone sp. FLAS-F59071]|eukprot:RUS13118.1 hypothetical protein BC937DRAFT_86309 [Endogone sp. FLAS-F59071]
MTSWLLQGNLEDDSSDSEVDEDFVPQDADDKGSPTGTSSLGSSKGDADLDDGAPSSSSKINGPFVQKPKITRKNIQTDRSLHSFNTVEIFGDLFSEFHETRLDELRRLRQNRCDLQNEGEQLMEQLEFLRRPLESQRDRLRELNEENARRRQQIEQVHLGLARALTVLGRRTNGEEVVMEGTDEERGGTGTSRITRDNVGQIVRMLHRRLQDSP